MLSLKLTYIFLCSVFDSITNLTVKDTYEMTPSNVSDAEHIYFTLLGDNIVSVSWVDNSVTCSSSNVGTAILLGTLPEKYRPTRQKWFTQAYSLNLAKGYQTSLRIVNNGQVHLICWWTGSNQNTPCVFTGVYLI